jgi:hypothetical protein
MDSKSARKVSTTSVTSRCVLFPTTPVVRNTSLGHVPRMSPKYFWNDFDSLPVEPMIVGIYFTFSFHIRSTSVSRSLNFNIFPSVYFYQVITHKSINKPVPFLSQKFSGLLHGMIQSVIIYYIIIIIFITSTTITTTKLNYKSRSTIIRDMCVAGLVQSNYGQIDTANFFFHFLVITV